MATEGEKLRLDNCYFYAASLQSLEHMAGYAVVGDDLIHVVDTADAAETTASELRRVAQYDDLLRSTYHYTVQIGLQ